MNDENALVHFTFSRSCTRELYDVLHEIVPTPSLAELARMVLLDEASYHFLPQSHFSNRVYRPSGLRIVRDGGAAYWRGITADGHHSPSALSRNAHGNLAIFRNESAEIPQYGLDGEPDLV